VDNQVKLYPHGELAEFRDGLLIRKIATQGNIQVLIKALKFSRSATFTLSCDDTAPPDEVPQSRGGQHINDLGLKLLTTFEGCKLESYDDSVGVWTIGYGHTAGVVPGMTITQSQAEEFLRHELELFESYVTDLVKVDLSTDQFSALVCFCYNTGPGEEGFGGSTLLRLLNSGDFVGAENQFLRWNKGGGEPMLGLTRRRLAEQALFRSQAWEAALTYDGPLDMAGDGSSATAAPADHHPRTLKFAEPLMQGEDVRQLQAALVQLGFPLIPDGVFGQGTDVAVRQVQAQKGLTVDGLVGATTLQAISMA
jgi:lysozyme